MTEAAEKVAEDIEILAQGIRNKPNDCFAVSMNADAIMHLAADLKFHAEQRIRRTAERTSV